MPDDIAQSGQSSPLAVVTGASSGIGLALARIFASNGFDLFIVAEDEGINAAADDLRSTGARVDAMQADLATAHGVRDVYERMASLGRPIDTVAINAGVGVGGPFVENSLEEELNLINLNVVSTVVLAKLVLRDMVQRNHGRVLFTSSIAADMPAPFEAVYGASRAFIQSFAEALRNELKDTNVTIDAALDASNALVAGKDQVAAGSFRNRAQDTMAKPAPETKAAEQHRKQSEPGSTEAPS